MNKKAIVKNIRKKRGDIIAVVNDEELILPGELQQEYRLKPGMMLSGRELDRMKAESEMIRAEKYAGCLLARREYSAGMLRQKIESRGFARKVADAIISHLEDKNIVNDRRYADLRVRSLLGRKPAGRSFLIADLRRRRIARPLAVSIVDELLGDVDENDMAVKLLAARWPYFSKFDLETARRKAYNYLSRRGIKYEAARLAFNRLWEGENKD
jgi:regulatory protein